MVTFAFTLSNKEQSLYRILTLFMISSLDEIKLQLLQQQKLCDEPFNFLLSNHARVMQSLSFFLSQVSLPFLGLDHQ